MAEVLVHFNALIAAPAGDEYHARVCADESGGLWVGWIEFTPRSGGDGIRTPVESEQPNRDDLLYWAEGLTQVYLEGALARALSAEVR